MNGFGVLKENFFKCFEKIMERAENEIVKIYGTYKCHDETPFYCKYSIYFDNIYYCRCPMVNQLLEGKVKFEVK